MPLTLIQEPLAQAIKQASQTTQEAVEKQLLQNIINNTLEFSHKGVTPVVTIEAALIDRLAINATPADDEAYCRITITDNGIGFDNQYAERIFTIFQRLHSCEKYDGTGIGLVITKKIIERHSGLIAANSTEGEGTQFVVVLPVHQQGAEELKLARPSP